MNKPRSAFIPVVFLAIVPAALGQLSICVPPGYQGLRFGEPEIENGTLVISVHWPRETPPELETAIEVLNREGGIVATRVVEPEPGQVVSYPLTEDSTFFEENGYWYTFRIVGSSGEVLAPMISSLVSFCRGWESCVYRIVEGVESESVSMSAELFGILDDLESAGSRDLLNDALWARPDLDFEIYWVADQIVRLQTEENGSGCICQWYTEYEMNPPEEENLDDCGENPYGFPYPDWMVYSRRGAGANFRLLSQILGGQTRAHSVSADSRIGIHLRCRAIDAQTPATVFWSGRALVVPTLDPCTKNCPNSTVKVSAKAESQAVANAWANSDHGAQGFARASAQLSLDQNRTAPVIMTLAQAELQRSPGDLERVYAEDSSGDGIDTGPLPGRDASATLFTEGEVRTCLAAFGSVDGCLDTFPRPDDGDSWAYACAASTATATLTAGALCATDPQQVATIRPRLPKGGIVIIPWRPRPGGVREPWLNDTPDEQPQCWQEQRVP